MTAPSRVFRVVVTQEVFAIVEPGVAVDTPDGMLRATDGDQTTGVDFGAIVRDALHAEDCGSLVWITSGVSDVSAIVELEAKP